MKRDCFDRQQQQQQQNYRFFSSTSSINSSSFEICQKPEYFGKCEKPKSKHGMSISNLNNLQQSCLLSSKGKEQVYQQQQQQQYKALRPQVTKRYVDSVTFLF